MDKERLKQIPVEDVAQHLGINVRRHSALCPFHDDHHPSLAFNVRRNTWKCYVCDIGGDSISLVSGALGLSFQDTCRWLSREFGIDADDITDVLRRVKRPTVKRSPTAPKMELDAEILEAIVDAAGLSQSARDFLFDKRHYSPDVVRQLHIGSVSDEARLVDFLLKRFPMKRLLKSGLLFLKQGKPVSYFHAPCLLFPYYDAEGRLVNLQARYLGDPDCHQRFQFPRGSVTHIYNIGALPSALSDPTPVYVTEGVTDCIAHLSAGHLAVAIPSATLLKREDITPLIGRRLVMTPDNDAPGQRLYAKLVEYLAGTGTSVELKELPAEFKDYSEFYSQSITAKTS